MLKIGIIGCGGIANNKHMPALKAVKGVEMVAFCDIVESRAIEAKSKYGIDEARVYTDYQSLLKNESLDVIHVCTPNKSHAEITIASLEAGKHVMCEKPMAKTVAEAQAMVEAAKRTGKKLTIGYQNRFRNDSLYLNEVCEDGELGEIYYAKAHAIRRCAVPTWGVFLDEEAQGGGPLIDIGTHALDLTLWMMNNYKPKYVVGNTYHKLGNMKNPANSFGPWNPEEFVVEDSAFGFITMENGATIVLESSWALNIRETGEAQVTLCGTEGGADMKDGLQFNAHEHGRLTVKKVALGADGVDFFDGSEDEPHVLEAKQWIDAILNNKEPLVKPEQALVVTQILEGIYKSAQTGKPVYFV